MNAKATFLSPLVTVWLASAAAAPALAQSAAAPAPADAAVQPPADAAVATRQNDGAAERQSGPVGKLAEGLLSTMERAGKALINGPRMEGATGLDDALRLARVLRDAERGATRLGERALKEVERAKRALHNGDDAGAGKIVSEGAKSLRSQARGPAQPSAQAMMRAPAAEDVGKNVINAEGKRLGEIDRLVAGRDGRRYAVVKFGGAIDWLGFIDFGNDFRAVPLEELVPGKRMVALARNVKPEEMKTAFPAEPAASAR